MGDEWGNWKLQMVLAAFVLEFVLKLRWPSGLNTRAMVQGSTVCTMSHREVNKVGCFVRHLPAGHPQYIDCRGKNGSLQKQKKWSQCARGHSVGVGGDFK